MTEIYSVLEQLEQRGFQLVVDSGRLQVKGSNPPDAETRTLIEILRAHKDEVLAILEAPACYNCGKAMSAETDIHGRPCWACWNCAKATVQ